MSFAQQGDLFRPISGSTERSLWATELRTTAFKPPSSIIEWHPLCGDRSLLGIHWKSRFQFFMGSAQQTGKIAASSASAKWSLWAGGLRTTAKDSPSETIYCSALSGERSATWILWKSRFQLFTCFTQQTARFVMMMASTKRTLRALSSGTSPLDCPYSIDGWWPFEFQKYFNGTSKN